MDITALFKLSYGIYIISTEQDGKLNGQVANVVSQVTNDPIMLTICLNKKNLTTEMIMKRKKFTISILSQETPISLIGKFGFRSGREFDKFSDTDYFISEITGLPVVKENTLSYLECEVVNIIDSSTHLLFLSKLINAGNLIEGEPMTYAYYFKVKNGKDSKNAPNYIPQQNKSFDKNNSNTNDELKIKKNNQKEKSMDKYVCTVCGYVYDPEKGDPDSGIEPGTSFEDLPDDWTCPLCGVSKSDFEKED